MSQDDTPPPRQTPRFVPTLTEIVAPPAAADPFSAGEPLEALQTEGGVDLTAQVGSSSDQAVVELLARLGPELDAQISETVAQVLHEQMPILNARIRQAVADAVRATVASANSSVASPNTGENP